MRTILIVVAMLAALLVVAIPAAQADPPDDYDTAPFQLTILRNTAAQLDSRRSWTRAERPRQMLS